MDGTLADLSSAYAAVEERLFGSADEDAQHPAPEVREEEQHGAVPPRMPPDRERVWREIESTPNFWTTLLPLEDGAVRRLYELTCEHNWEMFFVTQRPATAGRTVQWQTYKWLVDNGFETPSVIP